MKILYDVTHTSHCSLNTGIQRVVRRIFAEWPKSEELIPIVYDPYAKSWRNANQREKDFLEFKGDSHSFKKRGSKWSLHEKAKGWSQQLLGAQDSLFNSCYDALLSPELFGGKRNAKTYQHVFSIVTGPSVAIFHDMVALQLPQYAPQKTFNNFTRYLADLSEFTAILSVSKYSEKTLKSYWEQQNRPMNSILKTISLGVDFPIVKTIQNNDATAPTILCVGTLEGRKNHISLLAAVESLWKEGENFNLELIGGLNQETGIQAAKEISRLQQSGYPLKWLQGASDFILQSAYQTCNFTIYPSLLEGFGLPVMESLAFGKPCICSGLNAMEETTKDGGCLLIGEPSRDNLKNGIKKLLHNHSLLSLLTKQAFQREIKTWKNYTTNVSSFIKNQLKTK